MNPPALGDVIAERELEVDGAAGAVVRIGRPTPDPAEGGDWRCPFQIVGLGDEAVHEAFGIDAVQALQLCLQMIDIHLASARGAREITWLGGADLGFFPIVNLADPLEIDPDEA
ncbi:MAG TPA: hypothetical protein VGC13_09555 [Longimicrobium sp.]|jgi:hypothetical protein|uniref:DUF6968 family protein n=1 Tax=Longimicrobium sp. TaxID=2029185 RepID=UPI002ED8980E